MSHQNIYQMWLEHQDRPGGLWVIRNSWGNFIARVFEVGELAGKPPYFNNPKVSADFFKANGVFVRSDSLSSPGTFAYRLADVPHWFRGMGEPHESEAKRREGYPTGQPTPAKAHHGPHNPQRITTPAAGTRAQPSCPTDAHSRPEKPVLAVRASALPSISSPASDYVDNSPVSFLIANEDYSVENLR